MRDWKEYNGKLIERGRYYINPRFLESWNEEIKEMNAGKVGNPYFYPKTMIEFLAILHCKGNDYRTCEGIIEGISENYKFEFPVISYTQICRRVNSLEINFEINEDNLIVAGDGSGEKSTKRGGWMREKWKVKKGWIKVVILGTPDGKVVDIRVGTEALDERASVRGMIKNNHNKINKIILDGLHDCRKTFDLCEKYKIETAINKYVELKTDKKKPENIEYLEEHPEYINKKSLAEYFKLSGYAFNKIIEKMKPISD